MTDLDPFEINEAVVVVKLDLTLQGPPDPGYAATVDRLAEEHGPDQLPRVKPPREHKPKRGWFR